MEEDKKPKRHYKVEAGDELFIFRSEYNGSTFYKVCIVKTNFDKTKEKFYKNVRFKKDVSVPDRTKIRINDFFEDVYARANDKYNANWTLFITDFDILESSEQVAKDALEEYNSKLNSDDSDPFADFGDSVSIDENFLD